MCPAERRKRHQSRAFCAFVFAVLSGLLGLGFTLVKSPQTRSEAYLALAASSYDSGSYAQAAAAAKEAVRLNPVSPGAWLLLSRTLEMEGQSTAARKASQIASRLQQNPGGQNPLYALPAELRLSLLASAESELR